MAEDRFAVLSAARTPQRYVVVKQSAGSGSAGGATVGAIGDAPIETPEERAARARGINIFFGVLAAGALLTFLATSRAGDKRIRG